MTEPVRPFLKWPGGKRWLIPRLRQLLEGRTFARYHEPFLGGGAVFFGLMPQNAVLSDINEDLINTYLQVKMHADELARRLQALTVDKDTYITVRATRPMDSFERAVRFLYLNRTAFAGMYRLNREGHFNVPFGGGQRTPEPLWRDGLLTAAAEALARASIRQCDFEETISQAEEGDLVYCDPTYTVTHNNNGFVRYNERNFSWKDQVRLARTCRDAARRGAYVLVSNAVHDDVSNLYSGVSPIVLGRRSLICPNSEKRRDIEECLFIVASTEDGADGRCVIERGSPPC